MPPPSHEFTRVLQCFCSSASNADPPAHKAAHNLPTQAPKSHRLQIRWNGGKRFGEISKAKLCGRGNPSTHDRSTGNPKRTANQPDLQPSSQPTNQLTNQQESRSAPHHTIPHRIVHRPIYRSPKIHMAGSNTCYNFIWRIVVAHR